MTELAPTTLAWLAGFIDGEGSIGLSREYDTRRDRYTLRPCIQISNTSLEAMELVATLVPGGSGAVTVDSRAPHYKTQYHFALRRAELVLALLRTIRPYLVVKAKQADLLTAYLESRAALGGRGRRRPYTDADLYWYRELAAANKRGAVAA